jgi:plasmid stability protein
MATLVVRDLTQEEYNALKARGRAHKNRSMEAEARAIIRRAVRRWLPYDVNGDPKQDR